VETRAAHPLTGQFLLSIDRLTWVGGWSLSHTDEQGISISESGTGAALVGGGNSTGASVPLNPYTVPRLSVDLRVSPSTTVGLGLAGLTTSGSIDAEKGLASASMDGESRALIALTPRVGYLMRVTDALMFWGRAGGTYSAQKTNNPNVDVQAQVLSADFEGIALIGLGNRMAISATLALALPIYGFFSYDFHSTSTTTSTAFEDVERNCSMTSFVGHLGAVVAL
jgi:hypothetical protein